MKKSIRLRARAFVPALSVLSLAVAASVQAQGIEINPVVVSATRVEQPLSEVLSSVSVITRKDIERSQAASLVDLLQGEPGIEYGRNGGPGSQTSIFLRGQASNGLVVLVDGIRTQTDGGGFLTMTEMPLSQIERIEILRGNAGALYGEAAVGGMINIYTRQRKGTPSAYGSIGYGSKNTSDMNTGIGGSVDDYAFDLNIGKKASSGFSSMNPAKSNSANPDSDGYSSDYAAARFDKKIDANLQVGIRWRTNVSNVDYDAKSNPDYSPSVPTDKHQSIKKTDVVSVYAHRAMNEQWFSTLDVSSATTSYEEIKNNMDNGRYRSQQNSVHWTNNYQLLPTTTLNFGADYVADRHEQFGDFVMDRRTTGAFTGLTQTIDKFSIQANFRRDRVEIDRRAQDSLLNSQLNANSSLLGLGYQLNSVLKATATTSTGFRAPSATEISNNPNLTQEKFRSNEGGLTYTQSQTLARVVYFETRTMNAIDWFEDASQVWSVKNAGEIQNKGVEASLRSIWLGNSLKISAVRQDAKNVTGGYPAGRRAKEYGSFDISRNVLGYELGAKLFASGARPDINEVNSNMLAGYSLWSFYASCKLDTNWTGRVKLENAFNRNYELAGGYNTPGRGIFATLQYQPQ
ncbi:TonB-dependent receptor domain-containing protein [Limnohabitans sp.]|uniref:TonB-dependent receptor domain-containing protein n=1 Tax=Limnohabitans sp. TaxID=1907725 RepID=UPI00286EBB6C|nr:TonB-dependent receptor [Limnohabitans sp.]